MCARCVPSCALSRFLCAFCVSTSSFVHIASYLHKNKGTSALGHLLLIRHAS
ncbi:hypothetical protein HanIR_Chr03g0126931 [Helianthus annuus]|nr:hypothetical protein HanIR_Chr03g0126931 [Helianthus annuus]